MKGTAMITTTTTQRPVYVTTIKMGTVTYQTARSIQIKEDNGKVHKFTQSEIDARGVRLYMGDTPIRISQLNPGDKVTATIVSEGKPEILTAQAVDAQLASRRQLRRPPRRLSRPPKRPWSKRRPRRLLQNRRLRRRNRRPSRRRKLRLPEAAPLPKPYTKNPFFWLFVAIIIVALIWVLVRRKAQERPLRNNCSAMSPGSGQPPDPGGTALSHLRRDRMAMAIL